MWIFGKIIDFMILAVLPIFVSAWFIKKRWLATFACFGLTLVFGFLAALVIDFIGNSRESKEMLKTTLTQTWLLNIILMNIAFHRIRKLKK